MKHWFFFRNFKPSSCWLNPVSAPRQCPNENIPLKKVMVTIWWSNTGKIQHSTLPNDANITLGRQWWNNSRISDQPWLIACPLCFYTTALDLDWHNSRSQSCKSWGWKFCIESTHFQSVTIFPKFGHVFGRKKVKSERQYKMPSKTLLTWLTSSRRALKMRWQRYINTKGAR